MSEIPKTMQAMVLMGHGGMDQYHWHESWPVPVPTAGEVLVRVGACGLNNTDVNTRSGWYSKSVQESTTGDAFEDVGSDDPSWGGKALEFPRIQGADICGQIVDAGDGVDRARIGQRVISDNWLRDVDALDDINKTGYLGSERDGGFAQYCAIPARNALSVQSDYSDAQLATFSCSYSTAQGMVSRADVGPNDCILIPGASGGVGGALVQLSKLRGARVVALSSPNKHTDVLALGADRVLPRNNVDLRGTLGDEKITVLADVVGGPNWASLIDVLQRGGRYTCSGAIAGPMVSLDLRTLYLRDLTFCGSTVIGHDVMPAIVRYIEQGQIKPVLGATYALRDLCTAQQAFIDKTTMGNIAVLP